MAEHLTLVTLRRALSSRAKVSEKVADDFLSAFISSIQEGLQQDGSVTINGLGTFKLQDVPARQSVNVATGERITIAGYKKIVFGVDTRRSSKATEEPIDPIRKLGEQAEEIKSILSELGAMTASMPEVEPIAPVKEPEPVVEQPERSESSEPEPTIEPEPVAENTEKAEAVPAEEPEKKKKPSKPFNAWLTGLITIGVFAMLLIIAYFVLRHQIVSWADGMRTTIEQRVNVTPDEPAEPATNAETVATENPEAQAPSAPSESSENSVPSEQAAQTRPDQPATPNYFDDSQRTFTDFQPVETVGQDSRLAWIAKKRYGDKAYWVFIYEANRDRLTQPDRVLPGTELRVPELPAELRDPNNPQTQALLKRLSDKYLQH